MKRIIISFILGISLISQGFAQNQVLPKLGKDPVKKIISAMTLEEKAALVVGTGLKLPGGESLPGLSSPKPESGATMIGTTQDLVTGAAGTTLGLDRFGIPQVVVADGPAGLRIDPTRKNDNNTYYCTAFPIASLLASSWDVDLLNSVGKYMGKEVLEYGVDVILGPGMNIMRNPLCGRNFEYYSEDPFVTGKMAVAMVNGVESNGVGTSVKHFAANNAETNRNTVNVVVSERALREIYLEGFRMAVQEAQPWTVMSSYNLINGTYTSQNHELLTNILRNDWGFKGMVMTDWLGGKNAVEQMTAGNDLLMPGLPFQTPSIIEGVKSGRLPMADLDRNVERILNLILQSPRFKAYKFSNKPDLQESAKVARDAAAQSMVLLKNSNRALPLGEGTKKIAAFGNSSYDIYTGGTGSGDVNEAYSIAMTDGLKNAGFLVNPQLNDLYSGYLKLTKSGRPKMSLIMALMGSRPIEELTLNRDIIKGMAETNDVAIITIGRISGEGTDRKNEKGDFQLSDVEQQLIKDVTAEFRAKSKKVIVILNIGGVIETATWRDLPDAILFASQAGQETGNAIADVLSGKVNPSGKLTITWPVKYEDVPSALTFPGKVLDGAKAAPAAENNMMASFMNPKDAKDIYEDGIYVGYRYYETFGVKPAWEFGYGLSYTGFEYSNLKTSSAKFSGKMTVTADVKNTGKVAGREVAEMYITAPAGKLDKPVIELKGFAKTGLLQPGESQTVTFTLDSHSLASFDPSISTWVADAGTYTVKVGASSRDLKLNGTFTLAKELKVKKESTSLVPKETINELKPSGR